VGDAFGIAVLTFAGTLIAVAVLYGIGEGIHSRGYRAGRNAGCAEGRAQAEIAAVAAGVGRWFVKNDGSQAFEWIIPNPTKRERDD
jgi:hypothetical protein